MNSKLGQGESHFTLHSGVTPATSVSLVERKGWGHPDTLADHLAEELSRAYSRWTLDNVGAILHHNFDKLALLGGRSEVLYGGGRMVDPVRVLVNGRATRKCGKEEIPVDDLIVGVVRTFFRERLPELHDHLRVELNVTTNSSPGAVYTSGDKPERTSWFAPSSANQLRERRTLIANDTSLGTGWAPYDVVETFVRSLADRFSTTNSFTDVRPWCGTDVKVMAMGEGDQVDVVLCVPQKSTHVPSRRAYLANCDDVLNECADLAKFELPDHEVTFRLNARDIPDRDELYMTYSGSSIESGDEGVVGRGNRVNGLITPLRPMNLEGANGKNPVYHVGKLYNIAARRIAERLHTMYGGYAEVHLVSATGQDLSRPWQTVVRMTNSEVNQHAVREVVEDVLSNFPALTDELVHGDLRLA
ncbi:methionine adenosyltransferase [Actinokineospora terrae]|uniref:S-adenosylmethionine synthetase n=1 Tax=Actinokineospora terrae TaxID=155974 RepID=A0A1H9XT45_9PSEU|nr:methionine adenosyltransferase [Actinokineospora terrae]SES49340.1 S-adenosylmethionine synthetase [Actinokineospora terrae]